MFYSSYNAFEFSIYVISFLSLNVTRLIAIYP